VNPTIRTGAGRPNQAIPAATVVVARDGAGLEVLLIRRNAALAFGGMWVFPGGRIDPRDRRPDAPDDELAAARRAAVREAAEETGLVLREQELVPFSHWTPPPQSPKRFTTWFFFAACPEGRPTVTVDGGEIHDHAWMHPQDALHRRDAGEIELSPPTWITLNRLARIESLGAALAAVRDSEPEWFATRLAEVAGNLVALYAGDVAYESGDVDAPGPRHRLLMGRDVWRYERD
jgi:8-oxo-dGTP pyrophosphatase MutT (NUDIX family)